MTGLRRWQRDPTLPERAGEPISVPREEEMRELVGRALLRPLAPPLAALEWVYARWKPRTSVTCAYALRFEDGLEALAVAKRYADGKERELAERVPRRPPPAHERLLERVVLVPERLLLWSFPADRVLEGLRSFFDARLLARLIEESGLAPPRSVRRRRIERTLLRYKPERRCVARVDLRLREAAPEELRLAARIHPREAALPLLRARELFERSGGAELAPRCLAADPAAGILLEEWLAVEPASAGEFAHAAEAGRLLERLHALPAGALPPSRVADVGRFQPLFAVHPDLERLAGEVQRLPPDEPRAWVHGDFHPDQTVRETGTGRWRLLDLDSLGGGDPLRDLASWLADHLDEVPGADLERALVPLRAGYGAALDERRLRVFVADELVRRAAASIRRLERGAIERAIRTLERARSLAPARTLVP